MEYSGGPPKTKTVNPFLPQQQDIERGSTDSSGILQGPTYSIVGLRVEGFAKTMWLHDWKVTVIHMNHLKIEVSPNIIPVACRSLGGAAVIPLSFLGSLKNPPHVEKPQVIYCQT